MQGDLTYEVSQRKLSDCFFLSKTLQPDLEKNQFLLNRFLQVQGTHTYNVNTDT